MFSFVLLFYFHMVKDGSSLEITLDYRDYTEPFEFFDV
jgi:hypothetical protein